MLTVNQQSYQIDHIAFHTW